MDKGNVMGSLKFKNVRSLATLAIVGLALAACQTPPPPPPPPAPAPAKVAGFSPEQVQALKDMGFAYNGQDWALNFSESKFLFSSGVDVLSANGKDLVTNVGNGLKNAGIGRVRVEGHTDNVGSAPYNQALSERRAGNVAKLLEGIGFEPAKLTPIGFGQTKPMADNASEEGRSQNRRVTLIVYAE